MRTKRRSIIAITAIVLLAAMLLSPFPQGPQIAQAAPGIHTYDFSTLSFTSAFSDSFEVDLSKWDGNGATAWDLVTDRFHDGSHSVKANEANDGYLTSDNIDLSGATIDLACLDFWFRKDDTETGNDFLLYFYDGSNYNLIADLDTLGGDDTWLHYAGIIDLATYNVSDFRIRFEARDLGSSENVWVDQLVLTTGSDGVEAWERLLTTSVTPAQFSSTGTPATCAQYLDISASDDSRWVTDLSYDDYEYNAQMYKFTIDEDPSSINLIAVNWEGHGEDQTGYDTTLLIWNYNTTAWENLDTEDAMGSDDGWLRGTRTNAANYISGGELFILAMAEHTEGGCPFLYGWNGENYKLIDATLNDAFIKRYEAPSYQRTTCLESKDGYYDLMLHLGLPETAYINNLGLRAVDHPEGTEVMTDPLGMVHTISNPQPVSAQDKDGTNVTSLLAAHDGNYWKSDLTGKDFSDESNLYDWVTITLPEGPAEGMAKLVVDVRESTLGEFQLWYFLHYLLGTPNLDYVINRLENDTELIPCFDMQMWLSAAFVVQYWDGSAWVDYTAIPGIGMFFNRPEIVPIDLSAIGGNQIRLLTPIGLREIDYVAVDYTADEAVSITPLAPAEATEYFLYGSTANVTAEVTSVDSSYAVLEQGDYINYKFAALAPPEAGFQRSFVFATGGYYYLTGPEVPENKFSEENVAFAESLACTPYAFSKWTLPRYVSPEEYDYPEYFHLSSLRPPFPADWDSLDTDYVQVVVSSDFDVCVQVAIALDGSGSIEDDEWAAEKNGLYNAINDTACVPRDGSVLIAVVEFHGDGTPADLTTVVVPPTIITDATVAGVLTLINGMSKGGTDAYTPLGLGIQKAAQQITGVNEIPGAKQLLNISTDGEPNVDLDGDIVSETNGRAAAVSARNTTLAAGIDEIDAEGIGGISSTDSDWLKTSIVYPQPGNTAPPFTAGWVYSVGTDADKFKEAICEKVICAPGCTLTVNSDGCCNISVAWDSGSANVSANGSANFTDIPCGTNVTLTANTSVCCAFDYWTGNVTGAPNSTNPITITMEGAKNITATCHWLSYNLTVESDGCCPIEVTYNSSAANVTENISAGGSQNFTDIPCCTNVTLIADDSDPCCEFLEWVIDGDPIANGNNMTVHMGANHTAVAVCERLSYNLTVESDGCCPIEVTYNSSAANVSANISAGGNQTFTIPCGTNVTIIADDSEACCDFLEWVVDGMPLKSGNNITVHMGSNHTAVAVCEGLSYNLTVESDGCCPIEVTYNSSAANVTKNITAGGSQNFTDIPCCTNVTLIADDSEACCDFLEWVVDGMPLKSGNNITVHMGSNHTAVAVCEGLSYNLTTNASPPEGGTVSGGGSYNCCTNVTVNATPADSCWNFTGWTGDLTGTDNPETIHIDGDKNVTANFARYEYTLTTNASPPEGGTVSGGGSYNCCTNVTVNATPNTCWYFTGWTGDLTGTDNPETIHIDGDNNVTANFARYSYNLTVSSDGCCPIEVGTLGSVGAGANQTFTDIPCCTNITLYADDSDPFCDFVEWVVDGDSQGAGVNNITVHIGANHTAIATCSEAIACRIGDTLFYDNNGNGVRDPYEPGIPGVQVNLYQDDGNNLFNPTGGTDDLVASVITDAAGSYEFTGLNCCATYWVYVVPGTLPPGLSLTTGANPWGPIPLDPEGQDYDLADFGYRPPIPVGGEVYPINKISVLAPWVGLVMFLAGPGALIVLRRKQAARQS